MTTAVATRDEVGAEVAALAADIAAAQAQEDEGDELLQTPILKIGQALTREVQDGEAEAGEFINTLTNEGLSDKIELIISFYNKGRFASDKKTNRAFVAFSPDIPDNWADFVGESYVGTPFSEHPEGEEQFRAAVNAKERDWGNGPAISTTHNYTSLVAVEDDGEVTWQPVRLSLKRTDVPAAKKLNTLRRMVLKAPWDSVLSLGTVKKEFGRNAAYVINPNSIRVLRKTTADEKQLATQLAQAVVGGRTASVGAEDALEDRQVEPEAGGGLGI